MHVWGLSELLSKPGITFDLEIEDKTTMHVYLHIQYYSVLFINLMITIFLTNQFIFGTPYLLVIFRMTLRTFRLHSKVVIK